MKDIDFDVLFRKAEELRALFIFGQRVIPFLEEIFHFVSDIKPLLDDINSSIQENLKKMPNASKQLTKVTEATEMATTEIMDIVDGLIYKSGIISSNLKRMKELNSSLYDTPINLLEIIYKAVTEKKDVNEYIAQLSEAIKKLKAAEGGEFDEIYNSTADMLSSIDNDSSSIMMSLQVQDITSQQIAAVNHLLETIQEKLGRILVKFQSSNVTEIVREKTQAERTNISTLHRTIAFDPDAVDSISSKATRQDEVDALLLNHNLNNDAINNDAVEEKKPATIEEKPKTKDVFADNVDDTSYFSQDDIDALFGK
jgi:chemotaxis regulatin CheY-phosphate phosphatase CheZ